jgi:RHS repeat-associated protein
LLGNRTSLYNQREGVTYSYSYNAAAQLSTMQSSWADSTHPGTLLTVNQYNALGEGQQATFGNGIVRNMGYDNRGRLTSQTDGAIYNFTLSYTADNNILTGNDSINGNWSYTYDDFGRVATSSKTGQSFSYQYDRLGNRWNQNAPQGGPAPQYSFDANNHITGSGVTYDAAGNITNDGLGNTYTYDAEGRVTTVSGGNSASYTYGAFGRRVRQVVGSSTQDFIFDQSGRAITQMSPGWARSELYAGGMHVATYVNNSTYFGHGDWLGTVRALTDPTGTPVETCTSLAFGDGQSCTGSNWSPLHFTGLEHDSESNLDHTSFRQYSSTEGRWLMPDPAGVAAVDPGNPQTWNRYAYVMNNPLSLADPLGLCGQQIYDYQYEVDSNGNMIPGTFKSTPREGGYTELYPGPCNNPCGPANGWAYGPGGQLICGPAPAAQEDAWETEMLYEQYLVCSQRGCIVGVNKNSPKVTEKGKGMFGPIQQLCPRQGCTVWQPIHCR